MKTEAAHLESKRLEPLTTVRFFGAVAIVACHWLLMGAPILTPRHTLLWRAFHLCASCVSGFFVLSGFILAWVYLRGGGPIDKRKFYIARFARIYPIFFLTLVADTPVYFASRVSALGFQGALLHTGIAFGSCVLMLQAWGKQFWGMDFPNWSLSVEAFCYLLFPLVGSLLWRLRGVWTWISILTLYLGGQALVLGALIAANKLGVDRRVIYFLPPVHVSSFLLGVLVARLQLSADGATRRLPLRSWIVYGAFALAAAACIALLVVPWISDSAAGMTLVRDGCLAPVFALTIWTLSSQKTRISRWLSAPWLVLLGEGSYALYLIHVPMFQLLHPALLHVLQDMPWNRFRFFYGMAFLGFLMLCIALSVVSFLLVETPARRWINRKFANRRAKATQLPATLIRPLPTRLNDLI
jgi:peptidoglycan/LPS O-acetylase OafA/YrhL